MKEYFKEQLTGGATDQFFYGIDHDGKISIERHHGPLQTLSLDGLVFDRMMGSTPFFKLVEE